ncbi:hypothetical protein Pse7367_3434 [Thalassoporum mexicanum PCC 7367]|uniref:hypothetical protein n=1 Tax=Thalassoporum mexicanum TaxID=3457544 RepID=UPI00029F8ED3|nr:hypothetical protein [Pseudanabaena sp. PCC 7367]AFY71671.1 hypothetical protein Pse7367_3434 [Pseudanabaena sp. PCC 7367]
MKLQKLRNIRNTKQHFSLKSYLNLKSLSATLIFATATTIGGLIAFPLNASATPAKSGDRPVNQVITSAPVQQLPNSAYDSQTNHQTYFGIAPNGQPIAIDYRAYNATSAANQQAQATETWVRVADRVGKSECLQNVYTGKVLCQDIDSTDDRLVINVSQ